TLISHKLLSQKPRQQALRERSLGSISHGDHNLPDLDIAQHVGMRVGDLLEREGAVEYCFEYTCSESAKQVSGKTLTANQCLFRRACAEGDADDARAFACDLVEITVPNLTSVASDTYQPALDRQHPDIIGEHRSTDLVDDHIDAVLVCRGENSIYPSLLAG